MDAKINFLIFVTIIFGIAVDEVSAVCNTTALNSCVETFASNSYNYTQEDIFNPSVYNNICSLLSIEATCVSNASCNSSDVDNSVRNINNNVGNIDGYQYLCNLNSTLQQKFFKSETCFYTAAASGGSNGAAFQACYSTTLQAYFTAYPKGDNLPAMCNAQNQYNACQYAAILNSTCESDFATIYTTWIVRMSQIQFTSMGCTLGIPTTMTATTATNTTIPTTAHNDGVKTYHVTYGLIIVALVAASGWF